MNNGMDLNKYIKELSTSVTDYGYNDEYGYYIDWYNNVEAIIAPILTTVAEEARRSALEDVRAGLPKEKDDTNTIEMHPSSVGARGQYERWAYNNAIRDVLYHLDSLTK